MFAAPVPEETDRTIVVSADEIQWMRTSWQNRWNRPPTVAEFGGLIQQCIKETVQLLFIAVMTLFWTIDRVISFLPVLT